MSQVHSAQSNGADRCATGLPASAYTEGRFLDLEEDLLFARTWVCIGILDDVPEPGDARPVSVAGKQLLMVRGALQADLWPVLVVYLVSSFLNAAYFLPIVYKAFFCSDEEALFEKKVDEAPKCCVVPLTITATISIGLFFYPDIFKKLAEVTMGLL